MGQYHLNNQNVMYLTQEKSKMNCETCIMNQHREGEHCYMFKEAPAECSRNDKKICGDCDFLSIMPDADHGECLMTFQVHHIQDECDCEDIKEIK